LLLLQLLQPPSSEFAWQPVLLLVALPLSLMMLLLPRLQTLTH
jgi:hypothetical protein